MGIHTRRCAACVTVLAIAASLLGLQCGRDSQIPLNVLFITIDTLRADRLGCYGYDKPTTPNIDRLAEEGVRFENACCQAPLTLPSHCSIFTSRYTLSHGSLGHAYPLNPDITTVAEILKSEGFSTAAFVSNHVLDRKYGLARGFDTYWEAHRLDPAQRKALKAAEQDATTQAAVAWLQQNHGDRFFLWVHWFHPHKPYAPPDEYARRFSGHPDAGRVWNANELTEVWQGTREMPAEEVTRLRGLYDGEVAFSDAQLGLLLEELKTLGVYDRTLIVFTSDHGEVLYEHDRYFGHDIMLYEPSMRVPLILRKPGWEPAIVPGLVQLIDLVPTALQALGMETDAPLEGADLAPVIREEEPATADIALSLSFPPEKKSLPKYGLRTEGWKLILSETGNGLHRELYDLSKDPSEEVNLADADSERADALESYYLGWAEAVEARGQESYPVLDDEALENLRSLGYIQ